LSDRDYFQWLTAHDDENTFYSLPVQNKGNGKWVFYLAKLVNNAQHELLGLALVGVSVEVFTALFKRVSENLGDGTGLSLYRDDGTLLIRWPVADDMIGKLNKRFTPELLESQKAENKKVIFTDIPSFSEKTSSSNRMISIQTLGRYPLLIAASMTSALYMSGSSEGTLSILYITLFSLLFIAVSTALLLKAYKNNQKNQFLAEHDKLTSLPNRLLLEDRLNQALGLAKRNDKKFALLYVDIDQFKKINDTLGHDAGDVMLKETAKRLLSCIRETDTASRVGGDEFVVLLYDVENSEVAGHIAENILIALSKDIPFAGQILKTSASIGISLYPEHGQDIDTLQKHADIAMYIAKSNGRNQVRLFASV
jgi:diguanylate cyclase (GGDEF)-like protein